MLDRNPDRPDARVSDGILRHPRVAAALAGFCDAKLQRPHKPYGRKTQHSAYRTGYQDGREQNG